MSEGDLSEDSIRIMMDTRNPPYESGTISTNTRDTEFNNERLSSFPRLQILTIRQISREGYPPRHPVTISDGRYQAHGLLSPNLNHLINDGIIHENCIITVNEYFAHASTQFGATIIIILDCDVVESHQHRIGNPLPIYWYRP